MMKGVEYVSYVERLRDLVLFGLVKRRFISAQKYLNFSGLFFTSHLNMSTRREQVTTIENLCKKVICMKESTWVSQLCCKLRQLQVVTQQISSWGCVTQKERLLLKNERLRKCCLFIHVRLELHLSMIYRINRMLIQKKGKELLLLNQFPGLNNI